MRDGRLPTSTTTGVELQQLAGGYRESAGSWAELLRDCARRGMRAPVLAVGDGAGSGAHCGRCPRGSGGPVLVPQDRQRADRAAEVRHPGAKKALAEIWGAEDKDHALAAVKVFAAAYGAKFPRAVAKITGDLDELLAFCDYPAEH